MTSKTVPSISESVTAADLALGTVTDTDTIEAFGYEQLYRRGLKTLMNACMVIALTS
jgi:hypothetical protein